MELTIYNSGKKKIGQVEWPEAIFKQVRTALIHQVVVQQLENRRQGNARVKNRHEVAGSTRKIYRQKGTGGARHGDIKAPLFVGGGRAFGPKPRDWSAVIPQKIRQGALRDLVAIKQKEAKLWVIDQLTMDKPKTKEMSQFFEKFEIPSALLVLGEKNLNVERSVRNLPTFKAARVESLEPIDLLHYEHVIFTQGAFDKLIARLSIGPRPGSAEGHGGMGPA